MKRIVIFAAVISALLVSCSSETGEALKVISYNIRLETEVDGPNAWPHRREATLVMLEAESPDLVGMQEVLESQYRYLEDNAAGYGIVGVGRDDGVRRGEMMAVMYKAERFDKLDEGHFWLSETPGEVSRGWDGACNRMVTWLRLADKTAGREVYIFNTHLDHRGMVARLEGSRLIADRIESITQGAPFVLTGDFNAAADDPVLAPLSGRFASVRETAPRTDRKPTFNDFGGPENGLLIDHIYYRGLTPLSYTTLDRDYGVPYISDDYPVEGVFGYTSDDNK